MRKKSLKTLSLALTTAMVLSTANPGIAASAAPADDSVIEQQAEVTDEETSEEVTAEQPDEEGSAETVTEAATEVTTVEEATTETAVTETTTEAEADAPETIEKKTEKVPEAKKTTASSAALVSTVIENRTLLEMVVKAYNGAVDPDVTSGNMTVGQLQAYEGALDFSGATSAQISAVTSVKGLGIATNASSIDISKFTNVTKIEESEFAGCKFTTFKMPATITSIGAQAFKGCSKMTSIYTDTSENTLPSGLTVLGQNAFLEDSELTSITIPVIPNEGAVGIFSGCTKLTTIVLGDNVSKIPASAFSNAGAAGTGITVTFGTGLDKILDNAFSGANFATGKVDLSKCTKLTGIGSKAFKNTNLTTVIMPKKTSGIVELEDYVFAKTNLTNLYENGASATGIILPAYVSKLGTGAFYGNTDMTKISLPSQLKELPDYLFDGCTGLATVEVQGSTSAVKLIGDCAFRQTAITNTAFLTKMTQLEQIGRQTHDKYETGSTKIESIPLGGEDENAENNKKIDTSDITQKKYDNKYCGSEVFTGCDNLTTVTLPASVKVIAQRSFYFPIDTKTLQSDSVIASFAWPSGSGTVGTERKIYPEAFEGNIELTTVVLPENAGESLYIGAAAFDYNLKLASVGVAGSTNNTLPKTVSYMGVGAFMGCIALEEVHIQSYNGSAPTLCPQMFEACGSLKTATLPKEITEIPYHFFGGCPLSSFNFNEMSNLVKIGELAFVGHQFTTIDLSACTKLEEIGGGSLAFYDCIKKTGYIQVQDYTIPTFAASPGLTKVVLPANVEKGLFFDTGIFYAQSKFTTLSKKGSGTAGMVVIPSYVLPGEKAQGIFARSGISSVIYEADSGSDTTKWWKNVPALMFSGCPNITDAKNVMPKHVQNIGKRAFSESSITSADLTGFKELKVISTKSDSINGYSNKTGAFAECTELITVKLPEDVDGGIVIEESSFMNSTVSSIDLGAAVSLGTGAFRECNGLETIALKNVTKVGNDVFKSCGKLQTVDFGKVETIGQSVFEACDLLNVTNSPLPDTLTKIESSAFKGTASLGKVTFGSGITTIGDSAFQDSGVTQINFDRAVSLESIGSNAFKNTKITEFKMSGTKVTTIPSNMLYGCTDLESAEFGKEVEYIDKDALAVCPKFREFKFYASTTVNKKVFYSTSKVDGEEIVTGIDRFPNGTAVSINITIKTPEETVIPFGREMAFPYYVNEQGTSNIKYIRIYEEDASGKVLTNLDIDKYLSVKAKTQTTGGGYYKVTNSNAEGGIYKVTDPKYFTYLSASEKIQLTSKSRKWVDVVKVTGLEESAGRNLKFEIVADINFDCDSKNYTINAQDFNATYNVKVVDPQTSAKLYTDNKYLAAIPDTYHIQAINSSKGAFQCWYDLEDVVESESVIDNHNIIIETSDPNVLCVGAGSSDKKSSYTTKASTKDSSGKYVTTDSRKNFYLVPVSMGTATITVYPELYDADKRAQYKKTYTFTVGSDVKSISLKVPNEYQSKLNPGSSFSVFENYTNFFDQKCTPENMLDFTKLTNRPIVFTSSDPDYVSVDQLGNVTILKADKDTKNVKITATSVGATGIKQTREVTLGVKYPDVKTNEEMVDTATGAKVVVTRASKTDLQGEVTYSKPANASAATVTVPDTVTINGVQYKVTKVAAKAFKNNKKVKTVKIGKYVKTIEKEAFSGCTSLTKVTLGADVEKIETKAFYKCSKLTTFTIPSKSKLTTIDASAFAECKKLKSITIPSKVTTIGEKAFYNCKALKKITIKSSVLSSVGKQAFKNIYKKAVIKVPKKKLTAYKQLLKGKGQKSTVKIKK